MIVTALLNIKESLQVIDNNTRKYTICLAMKNDMWHRKDQNISQLKYREQKCWHLEFLPENGCICKVLQSNVYFVKLH